MDILHLFCASHVNLAFATCPPPYTAQFLSPAMIRSFAADPANDMTNDFVAEALAKGDECFGILDGKTLAAYSWYSTKPTRIRPRELFIEVDPSYVYMYKGFTLRAYRGQRLHAIGKTMAQAAYVARGLRGIISYVEFDNAESIKSSKRMGARLFGSILIVGALGHYFVSRTPGCREFGVRIERPHPGVGLPTADATRPVDFE